MSKFTKRFDRNPRDFYPTPYEAVIPLLECLKPKTKFIEPCAGNYALANHLIKHGHICQKAFDIEPQNKLVKTKNALDINKASMFITNPPFHKKLLLPLLDHFINVADTWLLLPADYMHNKYFSKYLDNCKIIISIGRVKWIQNSKMSSTDNFAWYMFTKNKTKTKFYGRKI